MRNEQGRYIATPNPICPACLLVSCDCTADEVRRYLQEESEKA